MSSKYSKPVVTAPNRASEARASGVCSVKQYHPEKNPNTLDPSQLRGESSTDTTSREHERTDQLDNKHNDRAKSDGHASSNTHADSTAAADVTERAHVVGDAPHASDSSSSSPAVDDSDEAHDDALEQLDNIVNNGDPDIEDSRIPPVDRLFAPFRKGMAELARKLKEAEDRVSTLEKHWADETFPPSIARKKRAGVHLPNDAKQEKGIMEQNQLECDRKNLEVLIASEKARLRERNNEWISECKRINTVIRESIATTLGDELPDGALKLVELKLRLHCNTLRANIGIQTEIANRIKAERFAKADKKRKRDQASLEIRPADMILGTSQRGDAFQSRCPRHRTQTPF